MSNYETSKKDLSLSFKRGMFSDTTADYVIPQEPQPDSDVTLFFRTVKNTAAQVFLVWGKYHLNMQYSKNRSRKDAFFDYYEIKAHIGKDKITYYFEVQIGGSIYLYDLRGVVDKTSKSYCFQIIPGFSTPDWAKGAVFYQIFVDRFCNGDLNNDVLTGEYKYLGKITRRIENWNSTPADMGVGDFYGGDLAGVISKLDYLKELGVEVIYLNPVFLSPSNHKYDIQDYDYIDPHFGKLIQDKGELLDDESQRDSQASRYIDRITSKENLEASNQIFIKLIHEAHKRKIKVILDGVFNHCGSSHKWMDSEEIYKQSAMQNKQIPYKPGAAISKQSPYRSYFYFDENNNYEGWWGYNTLPKLNFDTKELYDEVLEIGKKWVSAPFKVDGWRLDVAADLGKSDERNHLFWSDFRKTVKEANPNALILAEHYGNPFPWLQGKEWDSVMNYDAFMEPVTWFLTGMQKHSDDKRSELLGDVDFFWKAMMEYGTKFTASSLFTAMNELSNHDHSRFLTRTNKMVGRVSELGVEAASEGINKAVMREAVVIQMTWPGAPTIYYGDEAGLCGFTDPDNRRPYPWGHIDEEMLAFHKISIQMHKKHQELKTGSMKPLDSEYNILAYGRMKKRRVSVIIINNNDIEKTITLPVWELGIPKAAVLNRILLSTENSFTDKKQSFPVENGQLTITMEKTSALVLTYTPRKQSIFDVIIKNTPKT